MVERSRYTCIFVTLALIILLTSVVSATPQDRVAVGLVLPPIPPHSQSSIPAVETKLPPPPFKAETFETADGCWSDPIFGEDGVAGLLPAALLDKSFLDFDRGVMGELIDPDKSRPGDVPAMLNPPDTRGTNWGKIGAQSLFFIGIMHSWRLAVEPDTRAALTGKFFPDYWNAVKQLRGWSDGDGTLTNYIGHPMMGSISGRILLQNQPATRDLEPAWDSKYAKSMMKAFGYSFAFSLQWEVGLISEGTIGNATPNQYSRHPFSYVDIVITPTLGTVWTIGEDLLDKYVIRKIEGKTDNRAARILARGLLNPTRSFANILRLKTPWYREGRSL